LNIYSFIITEFEKLCNPVCAPAMGEYMKHKFAYFGIAAPVRKLILAMVKKNYKTISKDQLWELAMKLWARDEKELQYFAQDLLIANVNMMTIDDISQMEYLVMTKS